MQISKSTRVILYLAGALAALAFLHLVKLPGDTYFWREVTDFGHTPLFGVISLIFLGLFSTVSRDSEKKLGRIYISAFLATVIIGAAAELFQIVGPRDADIWDLIRDIAGAAGFLSLFTLVDRRVKKGSGTLTRNRKKLAVFGVIVLIIATIPTVIWGAAYFQRNALYPRVLVYDSALFGKFLETKNASLEAVPPPPEFDGAVGNLVGKLTFYPGEYCGLELTEPFPNWIQDHNLVFSVYVPKDTSFTLAIRIDDRHHNMEFRDRYTGAFMVNQGVNRINIPVGEIQRAPEDRLTDLEQIAFLMIFVYKPVEPFEIYIDELRLTSTPSRMSGIQDGRPSQPEPPPDRRP